MSLDPVTLAMLSVAVSSAGAITSYESQRSQANTQRDAIKAASDMEMMGLARQQDQQREAGAAQINEHARRARAEAAMFETVMAEQGGNTVGRVAAIGDLQAGEAAATISSNTQKGLTESAFQGQSTRSRTAGQLSSISGPSLAGTLLTIGGSALKGYQSAQPPKVK